MPPGGWPLAGEFSTLADALAAAAEQFGDLDAYVNGDERLSFAEWLRSADALAAKMAASGVGIGDVVALHLPASIEYAIACAAAFRLGAIATGLNPRLGPRELDAICTQAQPALVVRDPALLGDGLPVAIPAISAERVTELWKSRATAAAPSYRGSAADPVVIIWTSGTTGQPKGAWFDNANQLALAGAAGVISAPFDRKLSATPFAHAGYMGKLWDQLAWANTLVLCPTPWTAQEMARLLRAEAITVAGGAPTQWEKLLDVLEGEEGPVPSIRIGVVATAPAPPPLIERASDLLGCTLVVRYAMTESPSITGTEPGDSPQVKARTVGRPQAGMEVRVLDESGAPAAANEVGDVEIRGGCVMRGYWGNPELTASTIGPDGWLHTNDTGYFDQDQNLVLVGRRSEMYIRGGYNVYPLEVENVLLEHPGVAEAAIVGFPTPVIGEIGVAFVVASDPANPPEAPALAAWVRAALADYKTPDEFRFVNALPRTSMFKIDKEPLRSELETHPPVDSRRVR